MRWSPGVRVRADGSGWDVALQAAAAAPALPQDWLAGDIEQLQSAVVAA
jgi:hypothetical protein